MRICKMSLGYMLLVFQSKNYSKLLFISLFSLFIRLNHEIKNDATTKNKKSHKKYQRIAKGTKSHSKNKNHIKHKHKKNHKESFIGLSNRASININTYCQID